MDSSTLSQLNPRIGEIIEVECVDINIHGYGISRWKYCILFTPNLIPSEWALVQIDYKSGLNLLM